MQRSKPLQQALQQSTPLLRAIPRQRYVCASCRLELGRKTTVTTFSTQSNRTQRKLPWTEKIRRKIWGTDNPPGLKDPYDRESGPNTPVTKEEEVPSQPIQSFKTEDDPKWSDYTPATTWHGLTQIGETKAEADLKREFNVPVFARSEKVEESSEIREAFATVLEEVLPSVINFGLYESSTPDASNPTRSKEQRVALRVNGWRVRRMDDGKWFLIKHADDNTRIPIDSILSNKQFKLELHKGIAEYTGTLVTDSNLTKAKTIEDLFQAAITRPKAPKLAERLMMNKELRALKNVEIFDRRLTSIDKDIMVGRWKVIEKELRAQGIPPRGPIMQTVD